MPASILNAQRLLTLQSFKEATWGTAAAATAKWMLVKPFPELKPYRKSTIFDEVRGNLAPGFNSAILRKGGEFKIEGVVSYEDAIFLGHAIFGIVSPTGSTPYVYSYVGLGGSQPTIQSYSFEYNQAGAVVLATGCIGNKIEFKGNAAEQLEYSLTGLAQDIDASTGSSITSLSDRATEVAILPTGALYMDPSGSTIGSTVFNGTLISYSLALENSIKFLYTAGSLVPSAWVVGDKWKTTLTLQLLYTSAVKTFVTNTLMAGTQGLIRMKLTGSGSKYIQFDVAALLNEDPALFGEKDGAQMIELKLGGIYNSGAGLHTNMTVANTISAVP